MRNFLIKMFGTSSGKVEIKLFSVWHFLYLFLIVGGVLLTAYLLNKKASEKTRKIYVTVLAYVVTGLYIFDLFVMALLGDMGAFVDKLPFHICTIQAIFVPLVQFNKKFEPIKEIIASLSLVAAMMYMVYPGSALGGVMPWSYKVIETFAYHGVLFAWGCLKISTGEVKLQFKNIWKIAIALVIMVAWAFLGTTIYSNPEHHYDWFFVTGTTFPFVPKWLMPFVVVVAVLGVTACVYLIDYLYNKFLAKRQMKKEKITLEVQIEDEITE